MSDEIGAARDRPDADREVAARRLLAVIALLAAIACGVAFLVPSVRRSGFTPPIDDSYIHYRYAWELAHGHPFRYHPGDPVSTGESSPLYALVLWLFAAFRISRGHLCAIGQLLGVPAFGALLYAAARLVRGRTGSDAGTLVAVLGLALHGFLVWLFFSGMETGLYLVCLAVFLLMLDEWRPAARPPTLLLVASACLPLARPDGIVPLGVILVLLLVRHGECGGWRQAARISALVVLPTLIYLAFVRLSTGRFMTAGAEMKALTALPYLDRHERIARITENMLNAGKNLLLGHKPEFAFAGELPLALAGWAFAVVRDVRSRRASSGVIGLALFAVAWIAGAQVGVPQFREERYQAATYLLMVLGLVLAVGELCALLERLRRQHIATAAIGFVATSLLAWPLLSRMKRWRANYVADAEEIRDKQVSAALTIRNQLPRDARIYVCDAGAIAFLSERWTYDAVGLTTFMRGNSYVEGPGSRFEELEHWPPEKWPNYAAVYFWCTWGGVQGRALSTHRDMTLQEFDDPGLGTGGLPTEPHAGSLVDSLDVADLTSEKRHRWAEPEGGSFDRNVARDATYDGSSLVGDGGRIILTAASFILRARPGRPARLVARVSEGPAMIATVRAGSITLKWGLPAVPAGRWAEPELDLGIVSAPEIPVRIEVPAPLGLFHVWLLEDPGS